jgi:hypothetical protein
MKYITYGELKKHSKDLKELIKSYFPELSDKFEDEEFMQWKELLDAIKKFMNDVEREYGKFKRKK